MSAIKAKRLSFRKASKKFNVPVSSLSNAVKGKNFNKDGLYVRQKPSQNHRYLTDEEEDLLAQRFKDAAQSGECFTQSQAQRFVVDLLEAKHAKAGNGKRVIPPPSKKFWKGFYHRHPEVRVHSCAYQKSLLTNPYSAF